MGRHLAETTRLLRWAHANLVFSLLALMSAGAAMAIPGPAVEITGFSSVLVVGALALLAGHAWGILVIAVAEVMILGKALPIVSKLFTSEFSLTIESVSSITTSVCALPGLLLFVATLPYIVEVVVGAKDSKIQRPGEVLSASAAAFWLLQPLWA